MQPVLRQSFVLQGKKTILDVLSHLAIANVFNEVIRMLSGTSALGATFSTTNQLFSKSLFFDFFSQIPCSSLEF